MTNVGLHDKHGEHNPSFVMYALLLQANEGKQQFEHKTCVWSGLNAESNSHKLGNSHRASPAGIHAPLS